jgi:hypothetical protein
MSLAGIDLPVEIVGGLVCDSAPMDLPAGVSPDCQDVDFGEDGAATRPGLGAPYTKISGNVVNYLKTFITGNGTLRALALTDTGNLYKETAPGVMTAIAQLPDLNNVQLPYANSTTQFGKEWIALSDGKFGVGEPRQFDDTYLDRVSQSGPGAAPVVADEIHTVNILPSPNGLFTALGPNTIVSATQSGNFCTLTLAGGISDYSQSGDSILVAGVGVAGYNGTFSLASVDPTGTVLVYYNPTAGLANSGGGTVSYNLVTVTTSTAHGLGPIGDVTGLSVTIAGAGVGGYNGTWPVRKIFGSTTFLVVIGSFGLAASGNGTVSTAGNIPAGVHQVSVVFVTRSGYITKPAPPVTWTAAGLRRASLSQIPTGPPNVVQRILIFTQSAGAHFYYLTGVPQITSSNFVINDNTTTTAIVDFTDGILASGTLADYLFNQVVLGECAGVLDYANRMLWWGERAKVQNFINLDFNGGWAAVSGGYSQGLPLGWTSGYGTPTAGAHNPFSITGDAFAWLGAGATVFSFISQSCVADFFGAPILSPNTSYSCRIRMNAVGIAGSAMVGLQIFSPTLGLLGFFAVSTATLTANYVEYTGVLLAAQAVIPSDAVLRLYVQGIWNAGSIAVDDIEIFQTLTPNNMGLVRASRASNPESFDGVTGLLQASPTDGQAVRNCFKLRERMYIVKERSMYTTQDDGTNEPSNWSLTLVTQKVGTPSVRGVGIGEDWVVIADRSGLYIFWGSEPQKISQEVNHSAFGLTLAWDQINWQYAHTLWVTVDTLEKRILIGAPFNGATSPNKILMLDYRKIDTEEGATGAEAIAANGPIRLRYTGMKAVMDKSRKWSPWTIAANSCALIERSDGTAHLWMGTGAGTPGADAGAIYDLVRGQRTDFSTQQTIPSYYWTAFAPQREQNQQLQTHEHRKRFLYLTMFLEGAGMVTLTAAPDRFGTYLQQTLPSLFLQSPAVKELETNIDVAGDRVAFKVANMGQASWFRLQKLTLNVIGDPFAPVTGVN